FVMADIPGLIAGAADGAGLGHRFLGHVERCTALLHLIDATQEDVIGAYHTIRSELAAYDDGLAAKTELIALTKSDALVPEQLAEIETALGHETDAEINAISAVSGDGLQYLFDRLVAHIDGARDDNGSTFDHEAGWHPLREG
ncbi:MAG: GTPase, partial [Parvibaculales bacterium]